MPNLDAETRAVLLTMYATYLVSVTSPGPNVLLMLRAVALEERYANVLALGMGLATSTGLWLIATYLGFTTLIRDNHWALLSIRVLGVVFFGYVTWSLLASGRQSATPRDARTEKDRKKRSPLSQYATGVLFNLSNAGTALFFVTLFGPVVARMPSGPAFAAVSASIFVLSCSWQLLVSSLFFLKGRRKPRLNFDGRLVRYAFGLCFLCLTVKMAANLSL